MDALLIHRNTAEDLSGLAGGDGTGGRVKAIARESGINNYYII